MLTAGVDAGRQTVKVVVVDGDKIIGHAIEKTGIDVNAATERALEHALASAGRSREDLELIMSTGAGRRDVRSATRWATDVVCSARGAVSLVPSARTVVDL